MYEDFNSCVGRLERLGVPEGMSENLVCLMRVLSEMSVTDDVTRLDFLTEFSEELLLSIQLACYSRFYDDVDASLTFIDNRKF